MAQDVKSGSEELLLDISDLHVQYATDDATVYALNGFELKVRRGEKLGLEEFAALADRLFQAIQK